MLRTKCCHCIGRSARVMLRKSSPFATLLFDLSLEITKEEFASLKLAVSVDRQNIASKKDLRAVNYTADLFRLLEERGIISKTNLDYLTCLLLKLGRKDLVIRIEKYHKYKKDQEQTHRKLAVTDDTKLDQQFTKLKTVVSLERSQPSGILSTVEDKEKQVLEGFQTMFSHEHLLSVDYSTSRDSSASQTETTQNAESMCQESLLKPSSQESNMSVDLSQELNQYSQMSISDDEKVSYLQEESNSTMVL